MAPWALYRSEDGGSSSVLQTITKIYSTVPCLSDGDPGDGLWGGGRSFTSQRPLWKDLFFLESDETRANEKKKKK